MILVTGATGILGRVIVLELLKKGKRVRAIKRDSSDIEEVRKSWGYYTENPKIFFDSLEWVNADLNNRKSLCKALDGVDEVYHCAAKVSYDPADRKDVYRVNIQGTKTLLRCCMRLKINKFLFVSSAAIFEADHQTFADENCSYKDKNNTIYAISKYKADMEVCRASGKGLNTIIINPGMIIGSGNWKESSSEFLKMMIDAPYTFPGGTGCADVRDVATIAVLLMEKNIFSERFLIVSEHKKYRDLSLLIRSKIQKGKPVVITKTMLKIGRFLNIITGGMLPGLRMLTAPNIGFLTAFPKISHEKVATLLNFTFIPVEESILFHLDNFLSEKNKNP